ncbi:hypothetical protein HER10_EVM0000869 [Colletotrichum scovillei]|uniref:Phytanoyl-CoA dioxygenase family protein n=1 Tax=Colletotrichum scovillei TaxID=1209932 RepID=A0A9P7R8C3_9PEZI|nr:uncharacterized protein HER10_EVM0000869 [Colletotrichum scovillei]KAF4782596.1 hypothetical protein HER10_EVM0000869 [Colletotrichum scovillei]KAG7051113.1 phytanoyl-CoA dioxygenase family protein [Colletotrichum scovillei]KAG7070149.1 phytanoyl-CoA dioxygenase family protein [Colletotrichum scovillei]KAG7078398.1 phytanoyl-CoA dioxygenase family protein [Colletotrichum scovillei]
MPLQSRAQALVNAQTGADARLSRHTTTTSSSSAPAVPNIEALIAHVKQHGYVIIPSAFSAAEADEAHAEIVRLTSSPETAGPAGGFSANANNKDSIPTTSASGSSTTTTTTGGRNSFEGFKTHRIYALLNKSPVFRTFPTHPALLALNDHFLDPGFLLNAFHSVYIQPGEAPQALHHDDGYVGVPRPHRPFGTGVMVALDDFTPANGATVVIPGSHTWGPDTDAAQLPQRKDAIPVVMDKGSAVFFLGTLWHGGGENTSPDPRRALTIQYCQPWMRPLENQILAVEWDKLAGMPRRLVDLLGYEPGAPFVGYADGVHPWKVVQKRLREQEERVHRQEKL